MSQENVDVLAGALREFIDTGRLTDAVAKDFTWDMSTFRGWPEQPRFQGWAGFFEFMRAWREPYDDWSMAIETLLDAGGVYTVNDDKIRSGRAYTTAEEALEAVGLRE